MFSRTFQPIDPETLRTRLAAHLDAAHYAGVALRVAVDGPRCADPEAFARSLGEPLRVRGREAVTISSSSFWRDASVRLEYGRADADSLPAWLDTAALRREVLDPLGPSDTRATGRAGHRERAGRYLPSLRDPATNRATRQAPRLAKAGTVILVSGELLLGLGLPFDVTIHLALTRGARARLTPAELAWTLAAYDRYDADVAPVQSAEIVIRFDDPRHPAIAT
ncbi:MAG: uridine kinase [Actinomycetota bacterium]|nr:uridine kinase [Actinomycetota bacterium]